MDASILIAYIYDFNELLKGVLYRHGNNGQSLENQPAILPSADWWDIRTGLYVIEELVPETMFRVPASHFQWEPHLRYFVNRSDDDKRYMSSFGTENSD